MSTIIKIVIGAGVALLLFAIITTCIGIIKGD